MRPALRAPFPHSTRPSLMSYKYRLRATCPPGTRIAPTRALHRAPILRKQKDDLLDRESLNPQSSEYSRSGPGADNAAAQKNVAFDPSSTAPEDTDGESTSSTSSQGTERDALNVSPANQHVSKQRDPQEGGSSQGQRQGTSGGGSPKKHGGQSSE